MAYKQSQAIVIFNTNLEILSSNADFFEKAERLRPRLREFLNWESLATTAEIQKLTTSFLSTDGQVLTAVYPSLLLSLFGELEKYIRNAIEEFVQSISCSYEDLAKISPQLPSWNLKLSGQALVSIFDPPHHLNFDYHRIAESLSTAVPGSKQVRLEPIVFTQKSGNIDAEEIESMFSRVGCKVDWDQIGSTKTLQAWSGTKKSRDCANKLKLTLTDNVRLRNRMAHGGVGQASTSRSDLDNQIVFLRSLCDCLDRQLFV